MSVRMALLHCLGYSTAIAIAAVAADYAYYRGFDNGADAYACVMALRIDGVTVGQRERPCRNIKGRKPPPRLFPGTNGDEPTIWTVAS